MPPLQIRRALPQDARLLTELAFASKRHWGYPEKWIEEWRSLLRVEPELVARNEVWMAVGDEAVTGFYALGAKGPELELLHFWVHPTSMGRGVGRRLFDHATMRARELGFKTLYIESDPNAEGFYLRVGAKRVGVVPSRVAGETRTLPLLAYELSGRGTGAHRRKAT